MSIVNPGLHKCKQQFQPLQWIPSTIIIPVVKSGVFTIKHYSILDNQNILIKQSYKIKYA